MLRQLDKRKLDRAVMPAGETRQLFALSKYRLEASVSLWLKGPYQTSRTRKLDDLALRRHK